jgi:hypothetical protein
MSKPRRKRDVKSSGSVDEAKNVVDVSEVPAQPKKDTMDVQDKNQVPDNIVESQNIKTPDLSDVSKGVSSEKILEVLDLQSKYRELSDNVRTLNEKVTSMSTTNILSKPAFSEKTDETSKVLESLRRDLNSFIMYGKLFLGVGVAALLLYLINAIISLANSLRPAVA